MRIQRWAVKLGVLFGMLATASGCSADSMRVLSARSEVKEFQVQITTESQERITGATRRLAEWNGLARRMPDGRLQAVTTSPASGLFRGPALVETLAVSDSAAAMLMTGLGFNATPGSVSSGAFVDIAVSDPHVDTLVITNDSTGTVKRIVLTYGGHGETLSSYTYKNGALFTSIVNYWGTNGGLPTLLSSTINLYSDPNFIVRTVVTVTSTKVYTISHFAPVHDGLQDCMTGALSAILPREAHAQSGMGAACGTALGIGYAASEQVASTVSLFLVAGGFTAATDGLAMPTLAAATWSLFKSVTGMTAAYQGINIACGAYLQQLTSGGVSRAIYFHVPR